MPARDGDPVYNRKAGVPSRQSPGQLLMEAGVAAGQIETVSRGPTEPVPGRTGIQPCRGHPGPGAAGAKVRGSRPDPVCPQAPTGLGNVDPDPPCATSSVDVFETCQAIGRRGRRRNATPITSVWTRMCSCPRDAGKSPEIRASATGECAFRGRRVCQRRRRRHLQCGLGMPSRQAGGTRIDACGGAPEQIEIATKGETTKFGAGSGLQSGGVRARDPSRRSAPHPPTITPTRRKKNCHDRQRDRADQPTRLSAGRGRLHLVLDLRPRADRARRGGTRPATWSKAIRAWLR